MLLKLLKRQSFRKSHIIRYFKYLKKEAVSKEIKVLNELSHPSIVKIQEVYEGQNHLYIILELLKGGDLHSRKKPLQSMSIEIIAYIVMQLIEGLEHMHSRGYMHRDMKPSNVAFKDEVGFLVKIIDFGFVEFLDSLNYSIKKCGTPGYLAPEIFINNCYDEKIDIYSLGIILFSLVSSFIINLDGGNPYKGPTYKGTIKNNKEGKINFIDKYKDKPSCKFSLIFSLQISSSLFT